MTLPRAADSCGKVYLVGAGPGDPGLMTIRGAACLAAADVVLYDGLVNPLLLRLTKGHCERTARTRREGAALVPQSDVNNRLIAEAKAGRTVVRLKGGDPYIFGRGSEEAAALRAANVPFEVVPGITAATAAGAYAGFSLTRRDISSAVAFITAHEDPMRESARIDYESLAKFPGTLVFYMGLSRLPEICSRLQQAGMSESVPAAVVCHATLPSQQVVEGTVRTLPQLAQSHGLRPPSLIVIGPCVLQRSKLSWFERLPLFGLSIGVTRPEDQADDVAEQIIRLGGEPVIMPLIEIAPVSTDAEENIRAMLPRLAEFQWLVFTSVNGVTEFFRHLKTARLDARSLRSARVAAIGTSTARRLEDFGILADLVPASFRAEALGLELAKKASGTSVLWVRASRGRDVLPTVLQQAGIPLEQLVVYENRDVDSFSPEIQERLRHGALHWVALSSPSIARRFAQLVSTAGLGSEAPSVRLASISPVTTAAAVECGLTVAAEATEYCWAGLLNAIRDAVRSPETKSS